MYWVKTSPRCESSTTWHSAPLRQGFGKQGPGKGKASKMGRRSGRSWPQRTIHPNLAHCPPPQLCLMGSGPGWHQRGVCAGESAQIKEATQLPKGPGVSRKKLADNRRGSGDTTHFRTNKLRLAAWAATGSWAQRRSPGYVPCSVSLQMRPVKPSGQRQ